MLDATGDRWQDDNDFPHSAQETSNFFNRTAVRMIKQSTYSLDLTQCDRWII